MPVLLLAAAAWLGAISVVGQDQCEQLRQLIARLQTQLETQTARLGTPACAGSARSICQSRIRELQGRIQTETAILRTCKNGVIPSSGISAPPPHLSFDLHPSSADDFDHAASPRNPLWDFFNNIPRNPQWARQLYDHQLPDAPLECDSSLWSYNASDWNRCTHDPVWTNHDKCGGGGHVNWNRVTYEGKIQWEGHTPPGRDDDYNIRIRRDDKALFTASNPDSVGMEFDSDETIDPFSEIHLWWKTLRSDVDDGKPNPGNMNDRQAMVIGLVGLDYEHSSFSELHPLYVLAINYEDLKWSFFVRNWGNEGYCSEGKNPWDVTSIKVILSNPTAADGFVTKSAVFGTTGTAISSAFAPGEGIILDVQLPAPAKEGFVVGDVEVQWVAPAPVPTSASNAAKAQVVRRNDNEQERIGTILDRLPPARQRRWLQARKALAAARPSGPARPLTLVALPKLTAIPTPVGTSPSVRKTADTPLQKRKTAAICEALGTDRARFPDLCKP